MSKHNRPIWSKLAELAIAKEKPSTFMLPPPVVPSKARKMSDPIQGSRSDDDKPRVRHELRRDGANLYVDIYFDEFKTERLIVGGDETIARMVESGELRLTADSKLVYEDGTPYVRPRFSIANSMTA